MMKKSLVMALLVASTSVLATPFSSLVCDTNKGRIKDRCNNVAQQALGGCVDRVEITTGDSGSDVVFGLFSEDTRERLSDRILTSGNKFRHTTPSYTLKLEEQGSVLNERTGKRRNIHVHLTSTRGSGSKSNYDFKGTIYDGYSTALQIFCNKAN